MLNLQQQRVLIDEYIRTGLSVVPIKPGEKSPRFSNWTSQKMDYETQIIPFFSESNKWGVVAGEISGNIYILDFDLKHKPECFVLWKKRLSDKALKFLATCAIEQTPSGGHHVFLKLPEGIHRSNMKYACVWYESGKIYEAFIESRGQGGQAVCYPTEGYNLVQGDLLHIPTIPVDTLNEFERIAKSFDEREVEMIEPLHKPSTEEISKATDPTAPWNIYNRTHNWEDTLAMMGGTFKKCNDRGSKTQRRIYEWTRPGKDPKDGASGYVIERGFETVFTNYSSSSIYAPGKFYNQFALMAMHKFAGDWKLATKSILTQTKVSIGSLPSAIVTDITTVIEPPKDTMPSMDNIVWTGAFEEVANAVGKRDWKTYVGALSAFSMIFRHKVELHNADGFYFYTPLYILSVASSGNGKSMITRICRDILAQSGVHVLSEVSSGQALEEQLIQGTVSESFSAKDTILVSEEFYSICTITKSEKGILANTINNLFQRDGDYDITKQALKKQFNNINHIKLKNVRFGILGTMTTIQFSKYFDNDENKQSGLFNRFLILPCNPTAYSHGLDRNQKMYSKKGLELLGLELSVQRIEMKGFLGDFMTPEAEEMFKSLKFIAELWDSNDETTRRVGVHYISIAIIHTLANGKNKIGVEELTIAEVVTRLSLSNKDYLFEQGRTIVPENDYGRLQSAVEGKVLEMVNSNPGKFTIRDISDKLKSRTQSYIATKKVIDELIVAEKLCQSVVKRDGKQKESLVLFIKFE